MADVRISELPAAASVTGSDVFPIVQSGTTKKATVNQVTSLVVTFPVPLIDYAALRALDSIALVVQTEMRNVVRQVSGLWTKSDWFLIAGTTADDNDTVLRPHDFALTTNEKIWIKVGGY